MYPPGLIERRREALLKYSPGFAHLTSWTPAASLGEMDRTGIAAALLSVAPKGVWFGHVEESRELTIHVNEYAAGMVRDYPGRYGLLASLPLPDVDWCLRHIEYVFDFLHADGVGLMSNYDSMWPGHPKFAPIWDELNRRNAVVYFHPSSPVQCENLLPELSAPIIELPFDTTRAVVDLLYSGTLARHRNITWIFSQGGGTVPFLAERIGLWARIKKDDPKWVARVPNGVDYELRRLYFDIAQVSNPVSMAALLKFVPATQLMFGSDFPFIPIDRCHREFDRIRAMLSSEEAQMIQSGTAKRLFPRLQSKLS